MLKKKLNKIISGIILLIFCLGIFATGCNISISSEWGHWESDGQYGRKCVADSKSRECRLTSATATTTPPNITPDNRW
jgi:hypothetical protein